jgi:hypothetical protein
MRARNLLWMPVFALLVSGIRTESSSASDLSWSTIDGGGASSAGDTYRVSGSTGQPDGGSAGGVGYDLVIGFWAGFGAIDSVTPTPTPTFTPTATATHTLTETPTSSPTQTSPPPFTATPTPTPTEVVPLPTWTPTDTAAPVTPTSTSSQATPTLTATATPTATPTATVTTTATETPADTVTPTATGIATTTSTATPTGTATPIPGDTNGDGRVDASDLFYFSKYWGVPADEADPRCNPVSDSVIDEKDLLSLTREWK